MSTVPSSQNEEGSVIGRDSFLGAGSVNAGPNQQLTMNNIVEFLKDQQRANYAMETEFIFEKSQMQQKINQLEAQLRAQENINGDLIKRVKMLEFSLRQERIKYAKLASGNVGSSQPAQDFIGNVMQKANVNNNLYERIAKRRAKAQKPLLLKFLQEVGYEDIFSNEEVNEIKALYDKAAEEMKENLNSQNLAQNIEERILGDEQLHRLIQEDAKEEELKEADNQIRQEPVDESYISWPQKALTPKYILKGHLDNVRGIYFSKELDVLASISEDCTVKVWNILNLEEQYSELEGNLEPYVTLRGHTGPLFSMCGGRATAQDGMERVLYTAGLEGIVRVWQMPLLSEVNQYGDTFDGKNYCVGEWSDDTNEPIWDIKHNPYQNVLLSVSASNQVFLWSTNHVEPQRQDIHGKILNTFSFSSPVSRQLQQNPQTVAQFDTPTSCAWLDTNVSQFVTGFVNSHLVFFDSSSGNIINATQISKSSQQPTLTQINAVVSHPNTSLVVAGHENGVLNFFDYNSNRMVKSFGDAHKGGVSAMVFQNNGSHLVTGDHDGAIRVWDIRGSGSYKCVSEIKGAHDKKFDEGLLCLSFHPSAPFFASGGADSNINIFEMFA